MVCATDGGTCRPAKAAANLKKHGVSFVEAASALQDPHVVYPPELAHEDRLVAIGHSAAARLLCVVNVDRCERDRIISARLATATEEVIYTEG